MTLARGRELAHGRHRSAWFPRGDYVYVGSAQRGLDARVRRHRRLDKRHRWHVDDLRRACRWLEARLLPGARGQECALAEQILALDGAERVHAGFGASDCRCAGHLIRFRGGLPPLPGVLHADDGVEACFSRRLNRFVVEVRIASGEIVRAHLPNTARLWGQLTEGCRMILRPSDDPNRRTAFSATRAWGGRSWISLEAAQATAIFERALARGRTVPGWGRAKVVAREVSVGSHRIDLRLAFRDGRQALTEIKSLSIAEDGNALFSRTPSVRGAAHLELLGDAAHRGERALAVFVVQRPDVRRLVADADADPGWLAAVHRAARRGVHICAYRCRVTPSDTWIEAPLEVRLSEGHLRRRRRGAQQ
jgi:sugar fermentation stimulation protein A